MLKKLREYFKRQPQQSPPQSTMAELPRNPDLEAMKRDLLERAIDRYWSSNFEATKDFRVEFVRDLAEDIRKRVAEAPGMISSG